MSGTGKETCCAPTGVPFESSTAQGPAPVHTAWSGPALAAPTMAPPPRLKPVTLERRVYVAESDTRGKKLTSA